MLEKYIKRKLKTLYRKCFFESVRYIKRIKGGVSDRVVYHLKSKNYECAGVHNFKIKENIAFLEFSNSLKFCGINVPDIYLNSEDEEFYLLEYVGDKSLYDITKMNNISREKKMNIYKNALTDLISIQLEGDKVIQYEYCYETKIFDQKQILFDFDRFYNFYLSKLTDIKFPENKINTVKKVIVNELMKEKNLFFMYRDFQPRNIMLKDNNLYYIDYQSGRKGPLQYDVASFLYSGSIELDENERNDLLNYYIKEISKRVKINKRDFKTSFYYFAFIRLIQVLGSYGYLYEKNKDKKIFKKIDKALFNINLIRSKIEENTLKLFIEEIIKFTVKGAKFIAKNAKESI